MAVIITNGATNLSAVNGFYRVEAYNLNSFATSQQAGAVLSTNRTIDVTFANAGNCQGLMLYLQAHDVGTSGANRGIRIALEEKDATAPTMTIASPCVVTITGHSYVEGQAFSFTTSGALPTNLAVATTYYVRNPSGNTFNVSATPTGALINTTGTQSGTHTFWADRSEVTYAITDITSAPTYAMSGDFIVPFEGGTFPYAVDTTASKWRFFIGHSGGTTGSWYLKQAVANDLTQIAYATWCDNAVSFSSGNDVIICKDILTVDQSGTLSYVTQTGATNNSRISLVITRSLNPGINTVKFKWQNPPSSSYTFTLGGKVQISAHGGMQIGTSASPIPIAQQAVINMDATDADIVMPNLTGGNTTGKQFIYVYGEKPTTKTRKTTFSGNIAAGATSLTTAETTNWVNGDQIAVGRRTTKNASSTIANRQCLTVTSSSGTTVNFSPAIAAGEARTSGGSVCLMNGYGVLFTAPSMTSSVKAIRTNYTVMQFDGVEFVNISIIGNNAWGNLGYANSSSNGLLDPVAYDDDCFITNCTARFTGTSNGQYVFFLTMLTRVGFTFDNVYINNMLTTGTSSSGFVAIYADWFSSGTLTWSNCVQLQTYMGSTGVFGPTLYNNVKAVITDNKFENSEWCFLICNTQVSTITGNYFWGSNGGNGSYGAVVVQNSFSPTLINNNYYDNNVTGLQIGAYTTVNYLSKNDRFGTIATNTTDFKCDIGGLNDVILDTPYTLTTTSLTNILYNTPGSNIRIMNYNNTTNDDRGYYVYGNTQRTGTGLTDTTVHTVGGYAIRFEPTSSTTNLSWQFTIPTGNIEGLTMQIGVWCKINSATYYAGTHQKPRLTVNYDNGTTTYAEATGSTSWQFLSVPFTPTTGYGEITVTLSGRTDATTTNAYVYFDDFSTLYPATAPLNSQTFDLWANALPVTPPIATVLSANDVWAVATSTLTGTGTVGKLVTKLLTVAKFLGLK